MKDLVVCIDDLFSYSKKMGYKHPVKGEIYTVEGIQKIGSETGYFLEGFNFMYDGHRMSYICDQFRPVDTSYGEVVCETIEQQIELEKVLI